MEKRTLLAVVLSALIFAVWAAFFPPPRPTPAGAERGTPASPQLAVSPEPTAVPSPAAPVQGEGAEAVAREAVSADGEERHRLTNGELSVELSNRGAAVTELVLVRYRGDADEPLELVQRLENPARALPLQLVCGEEVDRRLYRVEASERELHMRWSDGLGSAVEKRVELPESGYAMGVEVTTRGVAQGCALAVGTGMRNPSAAERENRFASIGDVILGVGDKVERVKRGKVKEPRSFPGDQLGFAGFADTYFLNLLRPKEPVVGVRVVPLEYKEAGAGGEDTSERALRVTLELADGHFAGQLLAAPKEYDLLRAIGGGVEKTLNFGFFHPVTVFFLKALRWIHGWCGNWGVAIILLTLAIRLLLFPLMHSSTVSMRKMQKLQPRLKAVQDKYRKTKSDPKMRAKMNQEVMELYRLEGVNPAGGCLPLLVQLPILWALYQLFAYAIELRHAPFVFWIHDLSARDPYWVTPILMTASMWLQQRLAPQVGDPQQQKLFRFMPLVFGFMFMGFPSGLVLYWLSNNLITILQQEVTFRLIGERGGRGKATDRKGQGK